MSNLISWVEELKDKADIVRVIEDYVPLQPKGRNYWACCPFHGEKTPSFSVNPEQKFFHCFGCNKSGDVIYFLQEHLNLSFMEAAELLSEKVGYKIPDNIFDKEYLKVRDANAKIYNINRKAADFYFNNFKDFRSSSMLDYLRIKRKMSDNTIVKFGIGCSLSGNEIREYLYKSGFDENTMIEAGLISKYTKNDFFIDRIVFPIINYTGDIIGFGGRSINSSEQAKYINTANTGVFDKRKELFGMNLLAKGRGNNINSVILVEGYMDVISLYQAGREDVVASMGTSLTKEQCILLKKRRIQTVYTCFDGDVAGEAATLRSLDLLSQEGLEVKVISIPENLDPDDYVDRFGLEGFSKLIEKAMPLIEYKIMTVSKKHDLTSLNGRSKFVSEVSLVLAALDDVDQNIYAELVSKLAQVDISAILDKITNTVLPKKTEKESKSTSYQVKESPLNKSSIPKENISDIKNITLIENARRVVLAACFLNKNDYILSHLNENYFGDDTVQAKIFAYCINQKKNQKKPIIGDVISISEEFTNEMMQVEGTMIHLDLTNSVELVEKSLKEVKIYFLREKYNSLLKSLVNENNAENKKLINAEAIEVNRLLIELTKNR